MALTDPMVFEQVRDALEALLIANQGVLFRTIGEQKQSTDAEQVKGNLRTVQVFYSDGSYPRGKSSKQRLTHEITFQLNYMVANSAKVDLTVLDDPLATPTQKQAALLASSEGSRLADRSLDELRRIVTQIIMSPINQDSGLAKYTIADLWLNNFRKSEPIDKGNLLLLTGAETLTCGVTESLIGEIGTVQAIPTMSLTSNEEPLSGTVLDADKPKVAINTLQ